MIEEWRTIEGYPYYQVSNTGKIKSLKRKVTSGHGYRFVEEKLLKQCKDSDGYLIVLLHNKGNHHTKTVHRLVAQAFIPNPDNLPQINHKDEDKTNNFVYINEDGTVNLEKSNLEWCTAKYNNSYGTRTERIFTPTRNEKVSKALTNYPTFSKGIVAYKDGVEVMRFPSQAEARRMGFSQGNISACCRGERKYHKGLMWKYAD